LCGAGSARRPRKPLVHRNHLQLVLRGRRLEQGRSLCTRPPCSLPGRGAHHIATCPREPDGRDQMSAADRLLRGLFGVYFAAFFIYLFAPLVIMVAATFNTSRFPTITPWQ